MEDKVRDVPPEDGIQSRGGDEPRGRTQWGQGWWTPRGEGDVDRKCVVARNGSKRGILKDMGVGEFVGAIDKTQNLELTEK